MNRNDDVGEIHMFDKVLVPTDFSDYSRNVLECIKNFPTAKEVVLLHIVGPTGILSRVREGDPTQRVEEAKTKLDHQKKFLENQGFNIKTRVEYIAQGNVSSGIQKVADEERVSLVAMGARGRGVIEGILLGNVAKNVLRYGNENLLLIRYSTLEGLQGSTLEKFCSQPFSRVLCPTDLSKPADDAIALIKEIKGVKEILLQHVVSSGETWKQIEGHVEEVNKMLDAMAKEIKKTVPRVEIHVSVGSPVEEICDLAKKEDVSIIAMSSCGKTHEKGLLSKLTVGSIAYDVTKNSDRPVLIVRTRSSIR
jgi:nucleotide-binding universal stress UspA family protein